MATDDGAGAVLIADLLRSLPDEEARNAARAVLRRWKGATVYIPAAVDRDDRARTLRAIVAADLPIADAIRRLQQRFGVSERQARRLLIEASDGQKSKGYVRNR